MLASKTEPYCGAAFEGSVTNATNVMRSCCKGAPITNPWDANDNCTAYCDAVGQTTTQLMNCIDDLSRSFGNNLGMAECANGSNQLLKLRGTSGGVFLAIVLGVSLFAALG